MRQSEVERAAERAAIRSRGVLGPAFAILAVVLAQGLGVSVSGEELSAITDGVSDLIVLLGVLAGAVVGIYGRVRAAGPIRRLFG